MWSTLSVLVALSLPTSAPDSLSLTNARTTYGVFGVERAETKILPGDNVVLSFDIAGAKANDQGKVLYSLGLAVLDQSGKVVFRRPALEVTKTPTPGSNSLPGYVSMDVGLDAQAGEYQVQVSVTDKVGNETATITKKYEVLPRSFGVVRISLSSDAQGQISAGRVPEGKKGWLNFSLVGFERSAGKMHPELEVSLSLVDGQDAKPLASASGEQIVREAPANAQGIPLQFQLQAPKAGKYTLQLKATDKSTGKTATATVPLEVIPAK